MIRAILLVLCLSDSMGDEGPLVNTALGKIQGFYKTSFEGRVYSAFEGIPYAQPPVGDLRFEPPHPVTPWNNVLNANAKYMCKQANIGQIQNSATSFMEESTEDCLYLNVYVPQEEISDSDNYDVIVNIHGGAFMMGSSSMAGPMYLMDRDIIYVNLNYRLGILGFLSTEDNVVPGNNGLKDQQMALKWVQSHIKQFGGNPKSVTLMGLSAGGASVHYHYFSPRSKGFFHRGISQSGTVLMPWTMQRNALQNTKKLATLLNCRSNETETLVNCLKTISANDLVKETHNFYDLQDLPLTPFGPVVEVESKSSFLTKHPYEILKDGEVYDVPWLTWISRDEGILGAAFINKVLNKVDKNWDEWSEHMFDYKHVCPDSKKKEVASKIKSFYFKNDENVGSNIKSLIKAFGDRLFDTGFETALEMQEKVITSSIYAGIYSYDKLNFIQKLFGLEVEGDVNRILGKKS